MGKCIIYMYYIFFVKGNYFIVTEIQLPGKIMGKIKYSISSPRWLRLREKNILAMLKTL